MEKINVVSPRDIVWMKLKKNKLALMSIVILSLFIVASMLAPLIAPYEIDEIDLDNIEEPPSSEHLLGTDDLGRDVLSRILFGGRVSLTVGIVASIMQITIGVSLGAIAGYFGGIVDSIIMRVVDIIMCFPFFIIAIAMAAVLGPSMNNIIIIVGVLYWTRVARIVRAEVLSLKEREYIEAAKAFGLNPWEIIKNHILPNVMAPVLVYATLAIANGILTEASLSFLGMGVKPTIPSWGNMLSAAQSMRILKSKWWMWMPPGTMVLLTVLSINFLGDGLRDALDPKLKI
jgi:peptide/nickel transport system permease protein